MREYALSISSAFAQGLVQQHTGTVDSIAFETCHNMIPAGGVLLSQPTLTSIGASAKWPANQVFEGPDYYALEWSEEGVLSFYTLNTTSVTKTLVFTEKVKRFSDISKDNIVGLSFNT